MNALLKLAVLAIALACVTAQPAIPSAESRFEFAWIPNALLCGARLAPTLAEVATAQAALLSCIQRVDICSIIEELFGFDVCAIIPSSDLPPIKEVYAKMQERGLEAELIKLRNCVADKLGFLTIDGTFDTAAYGDYLVSKVEGTNVADNTSKGVDTCPAVVDFNFAPYLLCVTTYCITGKANFD